MSPQIAVKASRSEKKKRSRDDDDTLEKSIKRFQITADAESEARTESMDDLKFSIGESQWPQAIKNARETEGRPCLTFNRIPTFLRQYTGEERQQRPAMLVDPVGSGADPEVARIFQGVLRHIEVASFADITYDTSYDWMLRTGWTSWPIRTEWLSDLPGKDNSAFCQEPRIGLYENPFSVYLSPIRAPDGTDPLWAHEIEDMSKEKYEEEFPNSKLASMRFMSESGNAAPDWLNKNGVRIALYWWLELDRKTLCLRDDGSTCFKEDLPENETAAGERDVVTRKVRCVKHNAVEVLERYDWLGKYIPIVPLDGTRLNVNGKLYRAGMVRDAKDAQRLYNIEITGMAEMIALAPKDPLYVAEGSLGNHEEEYRQSNRRNFPYLYYKAYDEQGKPLPPPNRASREPPIEAMSQVVRQADYDLKSVIGIYEGASAMGDAGPSRESEVAILTRQSHSDLGSVNWSDNLNRSIRYQGKILLDLFPKLITSARIQRIVNPDDSVKHAVIFNSKHSEFPEAQALATDPALAKIYDIGTGTYDVTLSTGPTYRTARQEAFRAMTAVVIASPELFPMIGDLWAKNADWPGADVLCDRLKKLLPPNLQDQDQSDPASQVAALQGQLQQLTDMHNQMQMELARAVDTIRTKRLDLESRERIAGLQAQAGMIEALLKSNAQAGVAAMQAELDTISHRMETLHESMSIEQDAGEAPPTPELPGQVEPKVVPITPVAPVAPVQPIR